MRERYLGLAVALLALIGAGIAGYLTYTHFKGTPPVCLTGGCEVVQRSRWSELFGIPVALLGLLAYLSIVASTLVRHPLAKQAGAT
ncbi:MAG: vitamin K epoxide reductase family protein, partial [Gaiellaceae bacterium]